MTTPVRIDPMAFYSDASLRLELGIRATALERGRRSGELRYTQRGGRILYRGEWIDRWLANEPAVAALASV